MGLSSKVYFFSKFRSSLFISFIIYFNVLFSKFVSVPKFQRTYIQMLPLRGPFWIYV